MVAAQPYYSLPAGTQEVDASGYHLLKCTLYGKFQVTTANNITGLGDKPQIFDCGIYNVLGEARDDYFNGSPTGGFAPTDVGSFDFRTKDGTYCHTCHEYPDDGWYGGARGPTKNYTKPGKLDTPNGSTSILSTHIDGANASWYSWDGDQETCYTLYDGEILNPTDKADCE